MDVRQALNQLKSNPTQFFGNMQGVDMSNPNAIIQNLMDNGKISQEQYNRAVNQARQMGLIKQYTKSRRADLYKYI